MKREDCIHPFDNGFVPEISKDRSGIIVTCSSPLISAVARKASRRVSHWWLFFHRRGRIMRRRRRSCRVSERSLHWAHLMRLTLELGWHDVHRALGKL